MNNNKKILFVSEWKEKQLNSLISRYQRNFDDLNIDIFNCRRKSVFGKNKIQMFYEYLLSVIRILIKYRDYEYMVLWQPRVGYFLTFLPKSWIPAQLVISGVSYSPKKSENGIFRKIVINHCIKRVKAMQFYTKEQAICISKAFPQFKHKIHFTYFPNINFVEDYNTLKSNIKIDTNRTVYCAGRSNRDFDSVIKAFRNTSVPVVIVCPDNYHISSLSLATENIQIHRFSEVSYTEYYSMAHKAYCVVLPLYNEYSSYGHLLITFCMHYGLPFIATRGIATKDYIVNRKNGILVNSGSSREIYDAYKELKEKEMLRKKLCNGAKTSSSDMQFDKYLYSIKQIVNKPIESHLCINNPEVDYPISRKSEKALQI